MYCCNVNVGVCGCEKAVYNVWVRMHASVFRVGEGDRDA